MTKQAAIMEFPEKNRYQPETAQPYAALFAAQGELQDGPEWPKALRSAALTALERTGLPTPRLERWKYTNLGPALKGLEPGFAAADIGFTAPDGLVHKLEDILKESSGWAVDILGADCLWEQVYHDGILWNLANLFIRDGLVIDVPAGQVAAAPVDIAIKGNEGTFFVPRTVIRLGEGAELTVIERHTGEGRYWNNSLTQIIVGKNAKLRHYRLQENGTDAVYTQNTHVTIDRDGTYDAFVLTTGAGLSRNQLQAELIGENAACHLNGINMLRGKQLGDTTLEAIHKAPHCESNQFYRTILDDQARGVFQGKVYVAQDAQKTDGYQLSNTLLLSEGAEMDTKPELEIYADDVKCSHGATTGQLDDDPLFYLRSRGMTEVDARGLLIRAFLNEVVEKLGDETVQDEARQRIEQWLGA